jgi:chromosome segregation ATPase
VKGFIGGILEGILAHMGYATTREQALALELAQVKDQLGTTTARYEAAMALAEERLALLTASAALADERVVLLAAAAARGDEALSRAESAEKQLEQARKEHAPAANHIVRLELRLQALMRRRGRLQTELAKFQDQLARADVSGRIRELQEENARLQQRLADLQTYFTLRAEPLHAANRADERQGLANQR